MAQKDDQWIRLFNVSDPRRAYAGHTLYKVTSKVSECILSVNALFSYSFQFRSIFISSLKSKCFTFVLYIHS